MEVAMSSCLNSPPLFPRNGHTLVAGIAARISGCQNQKELSLDDQVDHGKQIVADIYSGPVDYRVVATKGKGERLDRPELAEIEDMLRARELDLLVVEDLGRMVRGTEAVRLCGIAVDHGTRVLAPNDCLDTAEDTWEEDAISACRDHVGHNAHTSKRLKQKLMNRFKKFGGATALPIFGYIKPPGAKTYDDWQKEPAAVPIYTEWLRLLRETLNCSLVADWLNREGIRPGKHCRRTTWTGAMVRRIAANPILMGMPSRGSKHTVKHNESGRRKSVKNPKGAQYRECPHLAFWIESDWREINDALNERNRHFRRTPINGSDPLLHVPRKRTRFPGQHARCWYCGRHYVWGANGMKEHLQCNGSREWRCWNSFGFHGALAVQKLTGLITGSLYALDGFDQQFRELVSQEQQTGRGDLALRWEKLRRGDMALASEKENLLNAIASYGPRPMFEQKLAAIEANERGLAKERWELERLGKRNLTLPASVLELRELLEEKFVRLGIDSPEFGQLMRYIVPEFYIYLVRLCDGGHLLPRARVRLNLGGAIPDIKCVAGLAPILTRELNVDLFDPPQREQVRVEAARLEALGLKQREIAKRLPGEPTQTAVQRALGLQRLMDQRGLESPYVVLQQPPEDYSKLRRHQNRKYRFEPLSGFEPPKI
jgi:site-specific DNA recombinase